MKIPDTKIDEIREATDIVEVISQYVTLKKRGKSFLGLCPFHTEKTPSFSVDPVRGFYHCFGCGAGGNVFTFVMEMEKVSFPEALRSLAKKAGISLPVYRRDDEKSRETEALYRANQFAAKFFRRCLTETQAGKHALSYLTNRKFSQKTLDDFQIGYAPDAWDGLLRKAGQANIRQDVLKRTGLIIPRKDGSGYYDRFRGRIMFPIMNPSGRIVGFGGRILKEEEKSPKYLNSPETPIYQKSKILYGLFQSKAGIRREDGALLVEGYTDVMRLHQCGYDFSVATSGTALTEDQARLLFRYTKNVVLVFDGDSAGLAAALRGLDILVGTGLNVKIAPLPEGSDPDSFLQERGKEALKELLDSAQTFIDFQLSRLEQERKLGTPVERAAAARTILNTIVKVLDPIERNLMIKDLAEKLGVEESLLDKQAQKPGQDSPITVEKPRGSIPSARKAAEEDLLKLLMEDGRKWGRIVYQYIKPEDFRTEEARPLIENLYEEFLKDSVPGPEILLHRFEQEPRIAQYVAKLLSDGFGNDVDRRQLAFDCVLNLRKEEIQARIHRVQEKMKSASAKGEDEAEYMRTYVSLKEELNNFKNELESDFDEMDHLSE